MRTLVVSGPHPGGRPRGGRPPPPPRGGRTGVDVLRRSPEARAALAAQLAQTDRLVLLGDTLELRHGPAREALAHARPVLEQLGAALPAEAEVVLVPGNHDYAL